MFQRIMIIFISTSIIRVEILKLPYIMCYKAEISILQFIYYMFLVFFIFHTISLSGFLRSIKERTGGQEYPMCDKNKKC
jgi:hypothetical protein